MDVLSQTGTTTAVVGPSVTGPVAILANPFSGHGQNRKHVDRFLSDLDAVSLRHRVVWDPAERAALLGDADLARGCRCIVSAGGDGSLADVVNDLNRLNPAALAQVPLATLPIGNENLFARQFGFTRRPGELARAIARGQVQRIDVGQISDRLFTLMASAGFDADVVHRMAQWRRCVNANGSAPVLKRVSRLSYAGRIVAAVRGYDYSQITVEADGVTVRGSHVFIFNLPQYGGNLGIARHASGDDGLLDYVVFEKPGMVRLATYGLSVALGRHLSRSDVFHGQAARIRLTSPWPVPIQADGDPAGQTPLDTVVRPGAMWVIDPRKS